MHSMELNSSRFETHQQDFFTPLTLYMDASLTRLETKLSWLISKSNLNYFHSYSPVDNLSDNERNSSDNPYFKSSSLTSSSLNSKKNISSSQDSQQLVTSNSQDELMKYKDLLKNSQVNFLDNFKEALRDSQDNLNNTLNLSRKECMDAHDNRITTLKQTIKDDLQNMEKRMCNLWSLQVNEMLENQMKKMKTEIETKMVESFEKMTCLLVANQQDNNEKQKKLIHMMENFQSLSILQIPTTKNAPNDGSNSLDQASCQLSSSSQSSDLSVSKTKRSSPLVHSNEEKNFNSNTDEDDMIPNEKEVAYSINRNDVICNWNESNLKNSKNNLIQETTNNLEETDQNKQINYQSISNLSKSDLGMPIILPAGVKEVDMNNSDGETSSSSEEDDDDNVKPIHVINDEPDIVPSTQDNSDTDSSSSENEEHHDKFQNQKHDNRILGQKEETQAKVQEGQNLHRPVNKPETKDNSVIIPEKSSSDESNSPEFNLKNNSKEKSPSLNFKRNQNLSPTQINSYPSLTSHHTNSNLPKLRSRLNLKDLTTRLVSNAFSTPPQTTTETFNGISDHSKQLSDDTEDSDSSEENHPKNKTSLISPVSTPKSKPRKKKPLSKGKRTPKRRSSISLLIGDQMRNNT